MQSGSKKASETLWDQYRCPTGLMGRKVAASMNKNHWDLSTWGLKHVRVEPGFVVLEVGSGGGKTISRLARRAFKGKVYGIDHSSDMVDYSREINSKLISQKRVEIVEGSIEKTDFKDEFFNLITAIETYYFWPNLPEAFREIRRILKTGGVLLIISEMVKDGIFEVENAEIIAETHLHLLTLSEIQKILHSAGFVNVKIFNKRKSPWNAVLAQKQ